MRVCQKCSYRKNLNLSTYNTFKINTFEWLKYRYSCFDFAFVFSEISNTLKVTLPLPWESFRVHFKLPGINWSKSLNFPEPRYIHLYNGTWLVELLYWLRDTAHECSQEKAEITHITPFNIIQFHTNGILHKSFRSSSWWFTFYNTYSFIYEVCIGYIF